MARALVALAALAVGALTSLSAVALHQRWWGLLLGLVATVATTVALPPGWTTRVAFVLGWVAALALLASRRPEGDYLVTAGPAGYALVAAGLALLVAAVLTLPRRGTPRPVSPGP
ncbi:hypothetical protein [Nocardioides dongkuii]|uniref:hypothetical protein n=1 Tax=Nocardioides dongkuii TaxID=2760089 RepID=UPI0015F94E61|nr:hypothetical protein [Nocardioides dongkuii]